jgi:hypothetical protein
MSEPAAVAILTGAVKKQTVEHVLKGESHTFASSNDVEARGSPPTKNVYASILPNRKM